MQGIDSLSVECSWHDHSGQHQLLLDVDRDGITIGRDPANVLVLSDGSVSRQHALLQVSNQTLVLRDLSSTCGTVVANRQLPAADTVHLTADCEVWFGRQCVRFVLQQNENTGQDLALAAFDDLQQRIHQLALFSKDGISALAGTFTPSSTQSPQSSAPLALTQLQQAMTQQFALLQQTALRWSRQNHLLQQISFLAHQTQCYRTLLSQSLQLLLPCCEATRGFVLMQEPRTAQYRIVAQSGYPDTLASQPTAATCASLQLARYCFEHNEHYPAASGTNPVAWLDTAVAQLKTQDNVSDLLCLPLADQQQVLALLYLDCQQLAGFADLSATFIQTLQSHLALTLKGVLALSRALTDDLTGLCTRAMLEEQISEAMAQSKRYQLPCCLMFIDLDDFKQINDTFGHQAGDEALKAVGQLLQQLARKTDQVGRMGGEEFVILMSHTQLDGAVSYAQRLLAEIRALRLPAFAAVRLTASIGVAAYYPTLLDHAYRFVDCADQAMYQAKNSGKDRLCVYQTPQLELLTTTQPSMQHVQRQAGSYKAQG